MRRRIVTTAHDRYYTNNHALCPRSPLAARLCYMLFNAPNVQKEQKMRSHSRHMGHMLTMHLRSTFPRPDEPTARARTARSTPSTRSPVSNPTCHRFRQHTESPQSTRLERLRCSRRVSVVMTASSPVMVVRPSPFSTRYNSLTDPRWTFIDNMQRAKTTKKVVLRLECTQCKTKAQVRRSDLPQSNIY